MRMCLITVFAVLFFINVTHGQPKYSKIQYKFSLDTAQSRILPFDIPFTVTTAHDKVKPFKYIYLFRLNSKGQWIVGKETSIPDKSSIYKLNRVSQRGDSTEIEIPALKPDKQYVIVAVTEENKLEYLKNIAKLYCSNNQSKIEDVKVDLEPPVYFENQLSKSRKLDLEEGRKRIIETFNTYNSTCDLCKKLKETEKKYTQFSTTVDQNLDEVPLLTDFCDTCEISIRKEVFFISGVTVAISKFNNEVLSGSYAFDTIKGRDNIRIPVDKVAAKDEEIFENMNKNLGVLISAKQSIFSISPRVESGILKQYLKFVNERINLLKQNLEIVRTKIKEKNDYEACLKGMDLAIGLTKHTISNSSTSYQFLTRNAFFIKPDFGVIYYGQKLFSNSIFSGVAPFVGFHINFRATNENVPFWNIESLWKFPTIQVGVPVFAENLSSDGSRKHLVGGKFSLFTGAGINLAHTARISFGSILFQSLTASSQYQIKASPYISIGIDIRLRSYFRGFSEAIQGVAGTF